ncbi:GAP family protein [Streptomyces sp. SID13666]|uniref:GAP family protein n=1 Tax=unclassified Streptomyces TaxID=2593676 RepID=UPI0013BF1BA8|nr:MULTISPECIES: GAP family protein [unclassified Streptomyces]NEA53129.1 GAP family protein [Streptomyces sp. SID13666]NEA69544.1 GAP family protein [Streptomyces sp. SID13588]
MVLDLVVIGLAITLGPLHNTAFILLLSGLKGVRKGLAFILAWLACLVLVIAGVVLMTGGEPLVHKSAPSTAALAVKLLLGFGMVFYGERKRRRGRRPRQSPKWFARLDNISLWSAAGLGILLQPWGIVAAGGATVVQANLSSLATYLALIGYVLLATSSLLVMELYATFRPTAAATGLSGLRSWIEGHQDQAIVSLSLGLGLWLVGQSLYGLVS